MLDVFDFIEDKGGDAKKLKESQRRRYGPEDVVEGVQTLYENARKGANLVYSLLQQTSHGRLSKVFRSTKQTKGQCRPESHTSQEESQRGCRRPNPAESGAREGDKNPRRVSCVGGSFSAEASQDDRELRS